MTEEDYAREVWWQIKHNSDFEAEVEDNKAWWSVTIHGKNGGTEILLIGPGLMRKNTPTEVAQQMIEHAEVDD